MSLIYITKSIGPRTLPCGIPLVTWWHLDSAPLTITYGKFDSMYMNFMKAFDKVPHRRLLHKMHRYKISEKVIKWVESFLSNRIQKVIVLRNQTSAHRRIEYNCYRLCYCCTKLLEHFRVKTIWAT
jgi:hypothetical protein